ncbi:hypothetical protein CEXT_698461 [Caerostris extrusa]|uniref:Uncharacterized protein n=1 Tax=Caerostris extrusa TaxID=172846 RepID=A0AAV4XBM5_CAEEX|nr:hypothetical protein CEXT_698461 [Caerostris extrusa]
MCTPPPITLPSSNTPRASPESEINTHRNLKFWGSSILDIMHFNLRSHMHCSSITLSSSNTPRASPKSEINTHRNLKLWGTSVLGNDSTTLWYHFGKATSRV